MWHIVNVKDSVYHILKVVIVSQLLSGVRLAATIKLVISIWIIIVVWIALLGVIGEISLKLIEAQILIMVIH